VNVFIVYYHFEEISSALNAISVHVKQKRLKKYATYVVKKIKLSKTVNPDNSHRNTSHSYK